MNKVLAIDVGTASVSAAVAEKLTNGKFFVYDVWRCQYDASDTQASTKILLKGSEKIFYESSKFYPDIKKVVTGFSSPFFFQKTASRKFTRANPDFLISDKELIESTKNLESEQKDDLGLISQDILESKVDGYIVESPIGYKGEDLEIKVNFLMVSTFFKKHLEKLKDKYFPLSEFRFFSDYSILKKVVSVLFSPKEEFTILDIGGEVSVFDGVVFPFGVCAIEKRVGKIFSILSSGHLDYPHERSVNKVLKYYANSLRSMIEGNRFKRIFLTGGGANIPDFLETIQNDFLKIKKLEAQDFSNKFLKLGPLSGGQDAVLAASIIMYA